MTTQKTIEQLYDVYIANINPAMYEVIGAGLGVSAQSLSALGVGYDFLNQASIWPERDATGTIIGLLRRFHDGKKYTVAGSKRGLSYVLNISSSAGVKAYSPGRHNWVRASKDHPCPLCGHTDWCLLSASNPASPPAVICGRTPNGATEQRECGYLHILTPEGDVRNLGTVLHDTKLPVLVVEGGSDVCAAYDLGFVCIGRPNDQGGMKELTAMPIANKAIVIVGENDAGAGIRGMEAAFSNLRRVTTSLKKLLPPSGVKDLRAWLRAGVTQASFLEAAEKVGDVTADPLTFKDEMAATAADRWIKDELTSEGYPTIRYYKGEWLEYSSGSYNRIDDSNMRGRLYEYLDGKFCQREMPGGKINIVPFKTSKARLNDVVDAMSRWCPIAVTPPSWLDNREGPLPRDLVAFRNGLLDVKKYCEGEQVLYPLTPAYFNMCKVEFDCDLAAECPVWSKFLWEITNGDQETIDLLAEWFGYNMVPDMSQERLLMVIGRPRSGKGTILEALYTTLGEQFCAITTLDSLSSPFGLQPLVGKLSAVIGDARTPDRREVESGLEKILQITGGDPVTVNRKHLQQLSLTRLTTRFTIAGNEIPNLTDHSRALEARTSLIQLPNTYVGREDLGLKRRIHDEAMSGALIPWALQGLKRLRTNGRFTEPASSAGLIKQFQLVMSPLLDFIQEYCLVLPAEDGPDWRKHSGKLKRCESKDLVYQAYMSWSESRGMKPMWKEKFCSILQRELPAVTTVRAIDNGKRYYAFVGLRLNRYAYTELLNIPCQDNNLPEES